MGGCGVRSRRVTVGAGGIRDVGFQGGHGEAADVRSRPWTRWLGHRRLGLRKRSIDPRGIAGRWVVLGRVIDRRADNVSRGFPGCGSEEPLVGAVCVPTPINSTQRHPSTLRARGRATTAASTTFASAAPPSGGTGCRHGRCHPPNSAGTGTTWVAGRSRMTSRSRRTGSMCLGVVSTATERLISRSAPTRPATFRSPRPAKRARAAAIPSGPGVRQVLRDRAMRPAARAGPANQTAAGHPRLRHPGSRWGDRQRDGVLEVRGPGRAAASRIGERERFA